ncbi:MAG: hypothetical protein M1831_003272 [Alyxoria varia]|nr:MAG: hypothetical protein M1831_003272 [Alyxoria varia]
MGDDQLGYQTVSEKPIDDLPHPRQEGDASRQKTEDASSRTEASHGAANELPDVHVSLIQPGGELKTPAIARGERDDAPTVTANSPRATHDPHLDYFSLNAVRSHSVAAAPPKHSPEQPFATMIQPARTRDTEGGITGDSDLSRIDSALSQLDARRGSLAAASTGDLLQGSLDKNQRIVPVHSRGFDTVQHPPDAFKRRPSRDYHFHPTPVKPLPALASFDGPVDEQQSLTVGNTPIQTPNFHGSRASDHSSPITEGRSPFPSPYLHPVQFQAPKETNKASRDVDLFSGRKSINQYEIISELGKGTHGKVKLARSHETGEFVAIKIVQRYSKKRRLGKAQGQEDKVKKEIAILKKALHPNVVSMIEVIDDPDLHKVYLVLEFCEAHEVRWRAWGETEVVVIENRRLEREKRGEADPDIATLSDTTLKAAMIKRGRLSQRAPRSSPSPNRSGSEFWSLELTGDADEEETDQSVPDAEHNVRDDTTTQIYPAGPMTLPANTPNVSEIHRIPQTYPDAGSIYAGESPKTFAQTTHTARSTGPTGVSGDYGFGVTNVERRSSITESAISNLTDIVENEIPEEERYVPLLTLEECRHAFREAVLGLEYLHYQGIVHRDIKPENLLRKADHRVKISDFGVSYLGKPIRGGTESEDASENESHDPEEEAELAKTVGTPAFYAPELCSLDYTSETPAVTGQIDVWALGVTLYCLLYAQTPFKGNNEFVVMRRISEDDVFIPRKRLKALHPYKDDRKKTNQPPSIRSSSHRMPLEVAYEDINDELYDLLKKLFIKDPRKRITLKEVKFHPWILRGISNPSLWLDETDPTRFTQGRKIEISKEEVQEAVIPLRLIERAKSVAKKVTGVLGLGGRSNRKRGSSSTTSADIHASLPATSSAPPMANRAERKGAGKGDDLVLPALKESREHQGEHPLSQSVSASPEPSSVGETFEIEPSSRISSLDNLPEQVSTPNRRVERTPNESVMSTATSVRTIKQSDVDHGPSANRPALSASLDQGEVFVPPEQDVSTLSNFVTILGGASQNLINNIRSEERGGSNRSDNRPPSTDPIDVPEHLLHGEPSVAFSNTLASGRVNLPTPLREDSPVQSAISISPSNSRSQSPVSAAHPRYAGSQFSPLPSRKPSLAYEPPSMRQSTYDAGIDERLYPGSQSSAHPVEVAQGLGDLSGRSDIPVPTPHSSDDRFVSEVSQSSIPSMPSAISADTSVSPESGSLQQLKHGSSQRPAVTTKQTETQASSITQGSPSPIQSPEEDDGYTGDHGIDSDDRDSDSDSENEFLVMSRPKSQAHSQASGGSRNRTSSAIRANREVFKSTRSGSSSHMDKAEVCDTPSEKSEESRPRTEDDEIATGGGEDQRTL